ncbi:MAG: redox-regulated ATPase YchF [Candidatus Nanoarchaeia archaeon]|nr:redox-regulated ATPase YchF [Candidatus Nanoarchaeia archaeon]
MFIGLVGKPSSGKSTFYRAATLAPAEINSRPFTTIKPNIGVAYAKVKCPHLDFEKQCNPNNSFCIDGNRFVAFKLMDVAGLVPGAHEGKGMGNQFLNDLSPADALIHVVDASGTTDEEGNGTAGFDPLVEVDFLVDEVEKWFFGILKSNWAKVVRRAFVDKKDAVKELAVILSGVGISEAHVMKAKSVSKINVENPVSVNDDELFRFSKILRGISKPIIIAANKMDLPASKENIERIKQTYPGMTVIPCCSEAELALREAHEKGLIHYVPGENDFKIIDESKLDDKQKKALEFIREKILGAWGSTGVQDVINKSVFEYLDMIAVFPVEDETRLTDKKGRVLPDAKLLRNGSNALDLAYEVHTDLGKNFIRAIDCRTKRTIGKDTALKNRDVVKIIA